MSRRQRRRSAAYRERRTIRRILTAGLATPAETIELERMDREQLAAAIDLPAEVRRSLDSSLVVGASPFDRDPDGDPL